MSETAAVRLRQITDADLAATAELLSEGFPGRSYAYWRRGLDRMRIRSAPDGYPRYGYLLDSDAGPVGVILLIFSIAPSACEPIVRCNVSSWYARPRYRHLASLLITATTRDRNVTYFNISALPHTWPAVEAQGFSVYGRGQMYALPILRRAIHPVQIEIFDDAMACLDGADREILKQYAAIGSLSVVVRYRTGSYPFVFQKHYVKRTVPVYRLAYCRDIQEFIRFAGNLGRFLLKRGSVWVQLDANARIPSLAGWYTERRGRKFAKGPQPPRLGDLSSSETAFFDS
jgi:hypothetical protein